MGAGADAIEVDVIELITEDAVLNASTITCWECRKNSPTSMLGARRAWSMSRKRL